MSQDNPERANGHIFNVGNPDNEASVKELAELMIQVALASTVVPFFLVNSHFYPKNIGRST